MDKLVAQTGWSSPDPATLKRRFKRRCEETNNQFQHWQTRVHRSLSWSLAARDLAGSVPPGQAPPPERHPEVELLYLWIAFNSLYAKWDTNNDRPHHDGPPREAFLNKILRYDTPATEAFLKSHKPVIKRLLGNEFLSNRYWRDPKDPRAQQIGRADLYGLDALLKPGKAANHIKLARLVFERVYVLRGQIVHGASTAGSRLNRASLAASLEWMRSATPFLQHLAIEHGAHADWPEPCYPVIR